MEIIASRIFHRTWLSTSAQQTTVPLQEYRDDQVAQIVAEEMIVIPNFVTEAEESNLMAELDPALMRLKYQTSHWDSAIENFRETEKKNWRKINQPVLERLKQLTLNTEKEDKKPEGAPETSSFSDLLPLIHVLDLAPSGWIKPHVDSVRYCGGVIAVVSLLSDSIARLAIASPSEVAALTEQLPASRPGLQLPPPGAFADLFVPRRSVYVMRGVSRYRMTHAILPSPGELPGHPGPVIRDRRVTVICRSKPLCLPQAPANGAGNPDVSSDSYRYGTLS
ncbi:Alpha-ketoglutarate-dependent dioxygenase alkB 7, mitochondrial [Sparganum proliferum]